MKELLLDTRFIGPLPQSMWGVTCSHCDKPQARWEMKLPDEKEGQSGSVIICSLCFLYESNWAEDRREALDAYIKEVEALKLEEQKAAAPANEAPYLLPFRFATLDNGRIAYAHDGDRLLAAIALANRTVQLRQNAVVPER